MTKVKEYEQFQMKVKDQNAKKLKKINDKLNIKIKLVQKKKNEIDLEKVKHT